MTLAARNITVEIGGEVIRLRPTLRAAMRLEADHGFDKLFRLLSQGSVTATAAILAEHADPVPTVTVHDAIRLAPQLADHLAALLDFGPQPKRKAKPSAKPIVLADEFARLFAIGSGVLGWTPADTWASSPAEILAAHNGRIEFVDQILVAVFGSKDKAEDAQLTSTGRDLNAASILRGL